MAEVDQARGLRPKLERQELSQRGRKRSAENSRDLSEAGVRALFNGWGLPPDPGTMLEVGLTLDKDVLDLRGEVVWRAERGGGQWLMAMRFVDVPERDADVLRRHVFRALREERTRVLD